MTIAVTGRPAVTGMAQQRLAICALYALLAFLPHLVVFLKWGDVRLEDDAYFYLVIARNIVEAGRSTFDLQTLTNGYHPLWQAIIVLQSLVTGPSPLALLVMEVAMLTVALWLLLDLAGQDNPWIEALIAAGFLYVLNGIVLGGMEVSALVLAFMLLLRALARGAAGVVVGLAAAAAIGARIDAALFVVPLVLAVRRPLRQHFEALAVMAVLGAIYAGLNMWMVGTPLPVSGLVKSLGGLQINHMLLATLAEVMPAVWRLLLPAMIALAVLASAPRGSLPWALALAYPVGLAAYFAKLLLWSSWTIWSWYFFPAAIGYVLVVLVAAPLLRTRLAEGSAMLRTALVAAGAMIALVVVLPATQRATSEKDYTSFRQIYTLAFERLGNVLAGQRIAIGDRAGSFGWMYRGPVTHIEGLVSDKAYFEVLARGGDVKGVLCRRGVKFLADWEVDLGDYRRHEVMTLKDGLTQFPAPKIPVEKRDEVDRISDTTRFDMTRRAPDGTITWTGNHVLYVWRLAC